MELPPIVSPEEWQRANDSLREKEKEATRAADALAAERRRQRMTEISGEHASTGRRATRPCATSSRVAVS